jgi:hypothetical protein
MISYIDNFSFDKIKLSNSSTYVSPNETVTYIDSPPIKGYKLALNQPIIKTDDTYLISLDSNDKLNQFIRTVDRSVITSISCHQNEFIPTLKYNPYNQNGFTFNVSVKTTEVEFFEEGGVRVSPLLLGEGTLVTPLLKLYALHKIRGSNHYSPCFG